MSDKILITGATGQIGSELTLALRKESGKNNVIALAHKRKPNQELLSGPFEYIDATSKKSLKEIIEKYDINIIYHLASILSAAGEQKPQLAWDVNVGSLKNILDLAVEYKMKQVFWPSSIAVFGDSTPKENTPQNTILQPATMYGITKLVGENLCNYYFKKYSLDVRSVRYPGLISYKTPPGGGTTDYAVEIFYEALKNKEYTCFLKENTILPMMYIDDAIRGTIALMKANPSKITIRTSYNFAAISFSAKELAEEIKTHIPGFKIRYKPDERQKIADSWPKSIDDSAARKDWNWQHEYDLKKTADAMLNNLKR
jgi:nucleoside-diphosphate-sugar epimerase